MRIPIRCEDAAVEEAIKSSSPSCEWMLFELQGDLLVKQSSQEGAYMHDALRSSLSYLLLTATLLADV